MSDSAEGYFRQFAETFSRLLEGQVAEPLPLPDSDRESPLHCAIKCLNDYIEQTNGVSRWAVELAHGRIYGEAPEGNSTMIQALKGLQASLRSLTWTTQQIAEGNFGHSVNFMGEFSDAFNSMAEQLESSFMERDRANEELEKQVEELALARRAMLNIMEDLEEARRTAEAATEAKSNFLANMSHEIRTPMNAIIGLSHLVLKTEIDTKQRDYIQKILSSARSLLGIINDILDFSKIEAGKLEFENIEFTLDQVISNVTDLVGVRAQEKGLELLVFIDPEIPVTMVGDPMRLGQVLINLATNGVKFTSEGEVLISVEAIEKAESVVRLRFSVKDSGIGITEEQRKNLFQPFSQADSSTTRKYGGTGLGLTISKRLVDAMGGQIWADVNPEGGSIFSFEVVLAWDQEQPHYLDVLSEVKGMKILVVDDNSTSREILKSILVSVGFKVELAENGSEAMKMLEGADSENPFNLVLMDWQMPVMDGLTASEKIKKHPFLTTIPTIIMVTAYGREEVMQRAEKINLDGFLLKPVNGSLLVDSIMTALGKKIKGKGAASQMVRVENSVNLEGLKVLVVEDNEINQQVARELLENQGVVVSLACDGKEALEAVEVSPFDLVLMDVQMPVMDGYEATRRIRSVDRLQNLPIIAMTANAMAGDREKAMEAGMNDYVTKPIDPDHLYGMISSLGFGTGRADNEADQRVSEAGDRVAVAERPDIEGIDTSAGLHRVSGNADLYRRLLKQFSQQIESLLQEVDPLLHQGQWQDLRRIWHSLKGSAGNLGAEDIRMRAATYEQCAKNEEKAPFLSEHYLETCQVLSEMRSKIAQEVVSENSGPVHVREEEMPAEQITRAQALLENLKEYLRGHRPKQTKEILTQLVELDWGNGMTDEFEKLKKSIERYRFKEGLDYVQTLESMLAENEQKT